MTKVILILKANLDIKSEQTAPSGSIYLFSDHFKIRISNHGGHKLKPNAYDLRSDAETNSKKRIYNIKDINSLIKKLTK